ncbi:2',3'-cyclic-nucleotide 3'-phosphodiesterase-like [Acipenser ruthenus]|uniref:2',3'-cyclic-nucleotide 3'-phosphodiesterase-like n=1 Tax=Acipenser ruthenus TaxID=7906 RepID=UPI002741A535|nr:2',3'-cyclic-nucleotide 3'-phosphodiesterase-like [Acipenser ruthenus]
MQEQALERAEGSLAFPFLDDEASIDAYRESRTLFIMRGLPGSGKSTLASTIAGKYEGICNVISADHKIRPEACPALPEKYKELDEEAGRFCEEGVAVVVIDDTNHQWERLEKLFDIASEYQYLAHLVEPKTPWKNDCAVLEEKTQWELTQSELEDLRGSLEEAVYPLFYGWFLTHKSQSHTKEMGKKLLETLGELDEFKEHWGDFGGAASETRINLEEYFDGKGILHCTTKFSDYGKATGAQEYAELEAVKEFFGSAFHLRISGLFITPRTAGARVRLSDKQLEVWPADSEKEATLSEELPRGSRAHITLGCAKDVEAVQTGLDLLEFIRMEKEGDQDWAVKDTDQGKLRYFGKGMWMLELSEEVTVKTIFGGFYPKEEGGEEAGVEKEGDERAVGEEREEKTVEKEGDERAVEKEGDERAVEEEREEKTVEKEGDERAVEKEGHEKAVEEKEGDEKAVEEKEGDERALEGVEKAVEKEGDEKAVEKEGDEKAVEEKEGDERALEGVEKAVEEKGEEKENQQEGKPAEGKKKGKCTIM